MTQIQAQLIPVRASFEDRIHQELLPLKNELNEQSATLDKQNESLDGMHRWKLSLWSNGSGGPKGWLEYFSERTNAQFGELFIELKKLRDDGLIKAASEQTENRVNDLRKERVKDKRDRVVMWMQVVGGILALFMFLIGAWSLYRSEHPAKAQNHSITSTGKGEPVVSSVQKMQEYAGPPANH